MAKWLYPGGGVFIKLPGAWRDRLASMASPSNEKERPRWPYGTRSENWGCPPGPMYIAAPGLTHATIFVFIPEQI